MEVVYVSHHKSGLSGNFNKRGVAVGSGMGLSTEIRTPVRKTSKKVSEGGKATALGQLWGTKC